MKHLTKLDFITSAIAAFSLLFFGALALGAARAIFLTLIPLDTRKQNILTLGPIFLVIIFTAFIIGAWLGSKITLRYFMHKTHQRMFNETYRMYALLAILSPIIAPVANAINKDSLLVTYTLWLLTLAAFYLFARSQTFKS